MTILVVDDHPQNIYQLEVLLAASGFRVATAADGAAALEKARQSPPDAIVSDILMPVMDGFSLCREWRRDPRLQAVPFVFYTATYTEDQDREFALGLGAARFLIKPEDSERLVATLHEVVRDARPPDGARPPAEAGPAVAETPEADVGFLRRYNEVLFRKLETKMQQVELANRQLAQDLSDLQAADERLREQARLISLARDAILVCDLEGRVEFANPAFERLSGWPLADTRGRPIAGWMDPADGGFDDRRRRVLAAGEWQGELAVTARAGRPLVLDSRWTLLRDAQGRPKAILSISTDITERKRAEDERQRLQAQLQQAQKMESIGTLASGVAHEINNPITAVMGYAQMLLREAGNAAQVADSAAEIVKGAKRVAAIVKTLLAFARVETQARCPVRLSTIVDDTLSLIGAMLRKDQVALDVRVPGDLPPIVCRSQEIQQVVMNLLTNARDALNERYPTADGNKILRLTAQPVARPGAGPAPTPAGVGAAAWVRLTVEDHGTGIPDSVRNRMFDPFFTTKPRDKGTGLGLSISHRIVRDHGGVLWAESQPGHWTQFHLDLPAAPAPGPTP